MGSLTNKANDEVGDYVVRVRGLPWRASESDLTNFFSGISMQPNGITFQMNSAGRPTGEAYVQLASKLDLEEALTRHKKYMDNRYIEVFASSLVDLKKNTSSSSNSSSSHHHHSHSSYHPKSPPRHRYRAYSPPPRSSHYSERHHHPHRHHPHHSPEKMYHSESKVIRMRGLPYSVTVYDILDFFYGLDITEEDIIICKKPNGLITGEGYIRLYSSEDVHLAMKKHKEMIGNRYIELFPSSEGELDSYTDKYYEEDSYYRERDHRDREPSYRHRDGGGSRSGGYLDYKSSRDDYADWSRGHSGYPPSPQRHFVIRMRGIPFASTAYDVQTFFNGFRILSKGIHFYYNSQGRPTGEAFVEFEYEDDYHRALLKNEELMGDRYIELFPSSIRELAKNEPYLKAYDPPLFADLPPHPLSAFGLPPLPPSSGSFPLNYPPPGSGLGGAPPSLPPHLNAALPTGYSGGPPPPPGSSTSTSSSQLPPNNLPRDSILFQLLGNPNITQNQMRSLFNLCDNPPPGGEGPPPLGSYYHPHKPLHPGDHLPPYGVLPPGMGGNNVLPPDVYPGDENDDNQNEDTPLYMRNLEMNIKVSDIEQFFQNYRYLKGSIEIFYNRFTGTKDGQITFNSPQEAQRACQEMNGLKIRSLNVQLSLSADTLNN